MWVQWQQTALLSILNFCSDLQHLSLGSCVMVSIGKFFFLPMGEFYPDSPHTLLQLFRFMVNNCAPHFQTFFLNRRVCL